MSIRVMSLVWETQLSMVEKMVLLAIADAANDEGLAWPSHSTLAKKCGAVRGTIKNALDRLRDHGVLSFERRCREDGSKTSHLYRINLEKIGGGSPRDQGRSPHDQGVGHHVTKGRSPRVHHEPSMNHKSEPCIAAVADKPATTPPGVAQGEVSKQSRAEHTWFIAWFCWACQKLTGAKYAFTKAEAGIIRQLKTAVGFDELMNRATFYLLLPDDQRFPRGSPTVKGLSTMFNQIAGKGDGSTDERCIALEILPADGNLNAFCPWGKKL